MPLPRWLFTHSASFCIGSTVSAVVAVWLQSSHHEHDKVVGDGSYNDSTSSFAVGNIVNKGCAVGLPIHTYHPNNNLTIAFDTRTKNPLFVMERLTTHQIDNHSTKMPRKNKRFQEEQSLLPYFRSRNQNYRNSGYDRGHLAPAADFNLNDKDINDTFVLTNVSPQLPKFNRSIWLRLEEFVRSVAKNEGTSSTSEIETETWVITGPLWLPSSIKRSSDTGSENFAYEYEGIGKPPSLVAVPTHFFKVVVVVEKKLTGKQQFTKDNNTNAQVLESSSETSELILKKFGAFVLPHSDHVGKNDKGIRLVDYLVRLTDLEAVTGLEFFPALFGTYANIEMNETSHTNSIPLGKEIADALTDDIRLSSSSKSLKGGSFLVQLSNNNNEEYSKGRRRKIREILHKNTPLPIQHLCKNNEGCFKILRV